ncbi:enolase C-terminal domain-like protein [Rhodopila globiformis]|uniref:Mandelate racemase n=1 Tax=Rhodopila globiformis TaxID=1071 RepID=A0A2S6NGD9_RHOGL|nr:enolase C-terminal domain-like protein [Rhodopila globiformis]PPQ33715.1 mandelate racemase [Rhodopila globiformis]
MKIDDVTLTIFAWDNIPVTVYHQGATAASGSNLGLLRIRTDAGLEGHAFLGSASNPASMDGPQLIRSLKPMLMGQDPLQRERIHAGMRLINRTVSYRTIGAVDTALWDLAGKIAGLPVHALMGTYRTSIPAYASSQVLPDAAAYVDQAQAFKARGWTAYKIHPPRDPERDIRVCEAVRKAVGDDFRLMLDSTWSYDYTDALRVGRAIEEMGYYWFEDPLADEDIYGYVKLRQKLDIPIMATEFPAGGLDTYPIWLTEKATDYLRGDIPNKGGLTTMLKTAHLAEAFGLRYEVHHSGNSLNNLANLHLCMALRNTTMWEVLLPDGAHKYGMVKELEIDADGLMHAPTAPGLGGEIDFGLVESKTEAVLR